MSLGFAHGSGRRQVRHARIDRFTAFGIDAGGVAGGPFVSFAARFMLALQQPLFTFVGAGKMRANIGEEDFSFGLLFLHVCSADWGLGQAAPCSFASGTNPAAACGSGVPRLQQRRWRPRAQLRRSPARRQSSRLRWNRRSRCNFRQAKVHDAVANLEQLDIAAVRLQIGTHLVQGAGKARLQGLRDAGRRAPAVRR